ncbi:MAG: hypothetical protein MN733_11035 [Nitrososphaera sp.]|nr:hypothetical protein [Nitrososphaera sp.]
MNEIPYAKKKRTSYENFAAQCPWCGEESVFNRATDLKDLNPIAFRTVSCQNLSCGKPFNINGDSVNSAHEMLILDCHELLHLKHYMNCALTLAQAHEVFFSLFLRVELLYKPFAADPNKDIDHLNRLIEQLADKVKTQTFGPMRALFLRQLISGSSPKTLTEAEAAISALEDHPRDPGDVELDSLSDKELVVLIKAIKRTTVGRLRNQVVHKRAYRPTREEVELALKETRSTLFPLTQRLNLYDDINWYMALNGA